MIRLGVTGTDTNVGKTLVSVALVWLWKVDGIGLTRWDITGAAVALSGVAIIVAGGWQQR